MGITSVSFVLQDRTPNDVFDAAVRYGAQKRLTPVFIGPWMLQLTAGNESGRGRRVLQVVVAPLGEGVHVTLQGWTRTTSVGDVNGDPRPVLLLRVPRRRMWWLLVGLANELGVDPPEGAYAHG